MVAPWSGKVIGVRVGGNPTGTTWGKAYGNQLVIDFDRLPDGKPGLWGVLAHMTKVTVKVGMHVAAGQPVGTVGSTGNATGPHLHFEVQRDRRWARGNYTNPQPWIDASTQNPPALLQGGKVYRSKMAFGVKDSDSVRNLQLRLNDRVRAGLPVTGNYLDMTRQACTQFQRAQGWSGADADGIAGPGTIKTLGGLTWVDDIGQPPKPAVTGELAQFLRERGFDVDDAAVPLGRTSTWSGVNYLMVHHTGSDDDPAHAAAAAHWIRAGTAEAPLAQLMIDQAAKVWVCCQPHPGQPDPGRASHAGRGRGYGITDNTMNQVSLGIECQAAGDRPLRDYPVLYTGLIRLLAALCQRYHLSPSAVIGHKEWSTTGKTDPRDDMASLRMDVANQLAQEVRP